MKYIIIALSLILVTLSVSLSSADIKDAVINNGAPEYTSVRNLPVIIENEALSNGRCRLHLDTGIKLDVSCQVPLE